MNIYCVGYGSYEESEFDYLTSEILYSEEALQSLVEEAAVKAVAKLKKAESYLHNYESIHTTVIEILVSDYDFKRLEVTAGWTVFGWPSIFTKDSWKHEREKTLDSLTDKIITAGYTEKDDSYIIFDSS